jgi:hypothetical protein
MCDDSNPFNWRQLGFNDCDSGGLTHLNAAAILDYRTAENTGP